MPDRPAAVLLDVGGIFFIPCTEPVLRAIERGGFTARAEDLHRAHSHGAAVFTCDYEGELPWREMWESYLAAYIETCGVPADCHEEVRSHLDSEFADAALWSEPIPGAHDGLRALAATGVRLGIVSNADGCIGQRLAEREILQVGPGIGVPVECVIDSGEVGVQKPDPRIFRIALEAMGLDPAETWYIGDMPGIDVVGARAAGLRPFVMDPHGLHHDADYERVGSLHEVAGLLA